MRHQWLFAGVLAWAAASVAAQDGEPDPGFGDGVFGPGRVVVPFNLGGDDADIPRAAAVDATGRIVVAGTINDTRIGVIRLQADGALDTDFGSNGKVTIGQAGFDFAAADVTLQPDGRIVIAGYAHNGSNRDFLAVRLQPDGSLDTGFGANGIRTIDFAEPGAPRDEANAVAIAADGDILLAGKAGIIVNTGLMGVVRLTPAGAPDTSFSDDGRRAFAFSAASTGDEAYDIVELSDGKLLLAGHSDAASDYDFALVRLHQNGANDSSFGNFRPGGSLISFDLGGINADTAHALHVDAAGSIFVAGSASIGGGPARFAVAKLSPGGQLDASFFGGGRQTIDFAPEGASYAIARSLTVQSDGAIVLAGYAARAGVGFEFLTARLLGNGVLDTSFGTNGHRFIGFDLGSNNDDLGYVMAFAHGRIVMAGSVQRHFNDGDDRDFGITRQVLDLLFTDDFE